jgi:uncharacterized protein (TIGR02453 family)
VTAGAIFPPAALTFLRGLKRHNDKPWFEAHRDDYELQVRGPMRALIEEMDLRLARFAPEIMGDPKRSMFRIHRDIRFSKDKSPYKTNAGCWFYHRDGSASVGQEAEGGGAGFYFHLEPGSCFAAGGLWMPPRPALGRLRDGIAENPKAFVKAAASPAIRKRFGGLSTDAMLKRMPRGFAEDHPAATWLRYQSFTLSRPITDLQAISARLPALIEAEFAALLPLVRWLNGVLGLKRAVRR